MSVRYRIHHRPSAWKQQRVQDQRQLRQWAWLAVLVVVVGALGYLSGWFTPRGTLPPDLVGRWETQASRYADRTFELSPDRVQFFADDTLITAHRIVRIREGRDDGERWVVITYEYGGRPFEFPLLVGRGSPPVLRFANQPGMVWRRQP